jgi:hypothetical protein
MLLVGALFVLVTIGLVVPCLIDVAVTPDCEVRGMTKPWWVLSLVFLSALGATAWLVAGRPRRRTRAYRLEPYGAGYFGPEDAMRRHPAGQVTLLGDDNPSGRTLRAGVPARTVGPDDDPEFLEELARRIRGGNQADNES